MRPSENVVEFGNYRRPLGMSVAPQPFFAPRAPGITGKQILAHSTCAECHMTFLDLENHHVRSEHIRRFHEDRGRNASKFAYMMDVFLAFKQLLPNNANQDEGRGP